MTLDYKQKMVASFANKVKSLGFRVFLAEKGTYGFITDNEGTRVLSFQNELCGSMSFSGNYAANKEGGTGWRICEVTEDDLTAGMIKSALYATAPHWAMRVNRPIYTTVQQKLERYGHSSNYYELDPLYTIEQYEQAKTEAQNARERWQKGEIDFKTKQAYESREFKVWAGAFADVTPERASPLPMIAEAK